MAAINMRKIAFDVAKENVDLFRPGQSARLQMLGLIHDVTYCSREEIP